jgi:predicted DNA-binding transcriptional regulator AlpA
MKTHHTHKQTSSNMELITPSEVMSLLHYTNRASFWEAAKKEGIPFFKITKRRILFCRRAVENWLQSKSSNNRKGGFFL